MVLTHIFPVQIAQHSGTKHEHRYPQGDESRILSEQWPIPVEVVAEEGEFWDEKEYYSWLATT